VRNQSTTNAWIAYVAVAFFWGTTFLAIRIGVQTMPPFIMAGMRHALAGLLICSYFLFRGYALPTWNQLKIAFVNGMLLLAIGNGLVSWAEMYLTSGVTALICALSPLAFLGANAIMGTKEPFTWRVVLGIVCCLLAQVFMFKDSMHELANPQYIVGIVFLLIAITSWGFGSIIAKKNQSDMHPLYGASFQMLSAGVVLLLLGTALGEWSDFTPTESGLWSIAYLVIFGSIIGYGSYMYILRNLPATVVSTYAYINTIVAVLLGWIWMGETVNTFVWLSVVLTISGVYLVQRK
jgi:drug/metabolite transporter (DMT)-like permease